MLRGGVGKSTLADSASAAKQAIEEALGALAGEPARFLWVFATALHDHAAVLATLHGAAPTARVVGCSGEGVIAGADSDEREHALAVLAVASADVFFEPFLVEGFGADPAGAGRALAARVAAVGAERPLAIFVFPDGLVGDCTLFLDALGEALPAGLPVLGGTAGDDMAFVRTHQFVDQRVTSGAVAAVLVHGAARIAFATSHGCVPIGLERHVTGARGGWLDEIDGRAAWQVFKDYLDGDVDELSAEGVIHLSLADDLAPGSDADALPDHERYVIRTPLGLDKERQALFFPGGGLAAGRSVRIVRRDPDRIRESAERCARRILDGAGGRTPAFVLQFDCAGRGQVLFGSCAADHIVRPLRGVLGDSVPWLGFHTYGEIAPVAGRARYQNYTVALCALFDDE